jgi:hypothetical protein
MRLRRLSGIGLMSLGALAVAVFAALAIAVVANYLEPENLADALGTVLLVTGPGIVAGLAVLGAGRWVHGGWRTEAPLLHSARVVLPVAGAAGAFVCGVMLVSLLATGFGPEDGLAAVKYGLGIACGGAGYVAGRRLGRAGVGAR